MKQRIVLDTNCLIASLSKSGNYFKVWRSFVEGKYTLCYSNEILLEYEEILSLHTTPKIANNIVLAIIQSSHSLKIDTFYRFNLIQSDPDDNKFVDCAVASNASYIVSEDKHFNELNNYDFPRVDVIKLNAFLAILNTSTT